MKQMVRDKQKGPLTCAYDDEKVKETCPNQELDVWHKVRLYISLSNLNLSHLSSMSFGDLSHGFANTSHESKCQV